VHKTAVLETSHTTRKVLRSEIWTLGDGVHRSFKSRRILSASNWW